MEVVALWAQVAASIAVLVTLIYLSIQIKQNTAMLHSESRQSLLENDTKAIVTFIDHLDLMEKLNNREALTYQDQWTYSALWLMDMRNREHEYLQHRAGVLDETTWMAYRQIIPFSLGTELDRQWWNKIGRSSFEPSFVAMVDELIADMPTNRYLLDLGTWAND